jgi:hypothetical protein
MSARRTDNAGSDWLGVRAADDLDGRPPHEEERTKGGGAGSGPDCVTTSNSR